MRCARVERGGDLCVTSNGRVAIGRQQRRDLERIRFHARAGGCARYGRQSEARENGDDRENANDFNQRKSQRRASWRGYCDVLLISATAPTPPGSPLGPYELISYGECSPGDR